MLLTGKKKGVSQNGQTPSIIGICSYCVLDRPVFERCQTLLHPEVTPWRSFLLADGAHHKKSHSPTHPQTFFEISAIWSDRLPWCLLFHHGIYKRGLLVPLHWVLGRLSFLYPFWILCIVPLRIECGICLQHGSLHRAFFAVHRGRGVLGRRHSSIVVSLGCIEVLLGCKSEVSLFQLIDYFIYYGCVFYSW